MVEEIKKKRPFKTFSYRGVDLDQLVKISQAELKRLFPARLRRKLNRGLKRKPQTLLRKLRRAKKEAGALEKPAIVKTHLRNMVILPEMVGSIIGVYNGRVFNQVEVKAEMIGHYLGEFSITYKPVKHGRPGIGATHSSRFIPLKMNQEFRVKLKSHIEKYQVQLESKQKERNVEFKHIAYGTAGFRGEACQIEHLFFNIGILSGLRAINLNANVGVMITASHNPIQDNGVKLIDNGGEMLHSDWEQIAEDFCNNQDIEERVELLHKLVTQYNIDISVKRNINVCIGMDTRPSSEALASLVKRGLEIWNGVIGHHDYGILTTPAIHYLVAKSNDQPSISLLELDDYYKLLIRALGQSCFVNCDDAENLIVDCANGVGAETMKYLVDNAEFRTLMPDIKLINCGEGCLNKDCGADFVKSQNKPPKGANQDNIRYAALDGDADRIVYFYLKSSEHLNSGFKLHLLDGDRILSLYAIYLKEMLDRCMLAGKLSFGIVQTPYANGASTRFLTEQLGLNVAFTDTGVKNLHKKALEYDLAVYFEANGHGTIHVRHDTINLIQNEYERTKNSNCSKLKHLLITLNNYTGDAISDMILVEIILQHYNWNIATWHELYNDRPNSLIKLQVPDKNVLRTTNAGQTCVEPHNIQPAIDNIVAEFGRDARCFVRPSGTENIVRVYAEASTQDQSDNLAVKIKAKLAELLCVEDERMSS